MGLAVNQVASVFESSNLSRPTKKIKMKDKNKKLTIYHTVTEYFEVLKDKIYPNKSNWTIWEDTKRLLLGFQSDNEIIAVSARKIGRYYNHRPLLDNPAIGANKYKEDLRNVIYYGNLPKIQLKLSKN